MAAKVFEKSAEETAFRAVLKEVYESGKNSVAVLWVDAALSARFQETLYAFLLKDVLGSAAAGVKLRALCAFCGGEAETAQTEYTHETFIGLMSPITKGENKGAVRLDLFFKKGEAHFIPTLFAYVMLKICIIQRCGALCRVRFTGRSCLCLSRTRTSCEAQQQTNRSYQNSLHLHFVTCLSSFSDFIIKKTRLPQKSRFVM